MYVFCLPIFDAPSFIDKERIEEELDDLEDTDLADDVERIVEGAARINMKYRGQITNFKLQNLNYVKLTRYRAFN